MKNSSGFKASILASRIFSVAFLLPAVLLMVLGCVLPGISPSGKDTCTPGDNMVNPRLVAGLEEFEGTERIRITWDTGTEKGAELPTAYFQAVTLDGESNVISAVALSAEREIIVEFRDIASYLQNEKLLKLTLRFPDRRAYISCRHAGMDDIYFLKITLAFASDGSLQDVIFEQGVWLGPI